MVVDWLNALHAAEPEGFDSAAWDGHTIRVTLTGYPGEPPLVIEPELDGRYSEIGAATGWDWVLVDPTSRPDPETPTYDALIAELITDPPGPALSPDTPPQHPRPAGGTDLAPSEAWAILALFGRLKTIEEHRGGWAGTDRVSALSAWFADLGIDVDADLTAAARTLRLPTDAPAGAITVHIQTTRADADTLVDAWVRALVTTLGPNSAAVVAEGTGRQIAHHTHPGTDPSQR